jgi:ferredoxin-type protein NapH
MKQQTLSGKLLHDLKNRGFTAWITAFALLAFYAMLYYTDFVDPTYDPKTGMGMIDRWAEAVFSFLPTRADGSALRVSKWTLYGGLYTIGILLGGAYMIAKYRHNPYQVVRTSVVMFVQTSFGFSIPILLKFFHQPEYYFSYFWPLKFDYLTPGTILYQPLPFVLYSFFGSLVLVPILTLLFGKRWYCSWVCGCGGLANTFGEPWRHLSSKSTAAWKFEKFSIHAVMGLAFFTTALYFIGHIAKMDAYPNIKEATIFVQRYYGLIVVAALSGVFGTGLYPLGGTRVWCRFFCPMAALLGLIQKLGRYRIRVKRDMCISCGMCSTYCEMGIDVRAYAQGNQSFTRASCVGCGLCAEVCPRGVLRLENVWRKDAQELSMTNLLDESWKGDRTAIASF